MEIEVFKEYLYLFKQLYVEEKIEISWSKESAGFKTLFDIDELLPSNMNKDDFLNASFSIIRAAQNIAVGLLPEDKEEIEQFSLVNEIFLESNQELISLINIHSSSNLKILDEIDFEILTKRSKTNPNEIISLTTCLNLFVKDLSKREDDNNIHKVSLELSIKEIKYIIETLENTLESLESINY